MFVYFRAKHKVYKISSSDQFVFLSFSSLSLYTQNESKITKYINRIHSSGTTASHIRPKRYRHLHKVKGFWSHNDLCSIIKRQCSPKKDLWWVLHFTCKLLSQISLLFLTAMYIKANTTYFRLARHARWMACWIPSITKRSTFWQQGVSSMGWKADSSTLRLKKPTQRESEKYLFYLF
jgi:hypothetical protein